MRLREFPEVTSELMGKELATDSFLDPGFYAHKIQGYQEDVVHFSVEGEGKKKKKKQNGWG